MGAVRQPASSIDLNKNVSKCLGDDINAILLWEEDSFGVWDVEILRFSFASASGCGAVGGKEGRRPAHTLSL